MHMHATHLFIQSLTPHYMFKDTNGRVRWLTTGCLSSNDSAGEFQGVLGKKP